jgi:hypothetical protein
VVWSREVRFSRGRFSDIEKWISDKGVRKFITSKGGKHDE